MQPPVNVARSMVAAPSRATARIAVKSGLARALLLRTRMKRLVLPLSVSLLAACSTGSPASPAAPDSGGDVSTSGDDGGGGDTGTESDTGTGPTDSGAPVSVTFAYAPQWPGVTKVEVVGGFGQSTDWSKTASFLTLSGSASMYTGTAMLPPGQYLYVFRVTGDDSASNPATYARYSVDPTQPGFASCPMASPTFSKIDNNPCSQLTVTSTGTGTPATPVHVTGSVAVDGAAAQDWMVVLEREEPMSHHYFANRVTVGSAGTFDLIASAGNYRLQVQYPTLLSASDLDRDPGQLAALRRAISASFELGTTPVTVPTPDLGFHDYALFAPSGDAGALPTSFTFETGEARLDVYGGPGDGGVENIGDPWFTSAPTTDGGIVLSAARSTRPRPRRTPPPPARATCGAPSRRSAPTRAWPGPTSRWCCRSSGSERVVASPACASSTGSWARAWGTRRAARSCASTWSRPGTT